MWYRIVFDNVLVKLDPEKVHHLSIRALTVAQRWALGRLFLRLMAGNFRPSWREIADSSPAYGREFSGKLGLAAGMDKDGQCALAWHEMGFAFVEVGTVTPRAQPGNDKPRLWRMPAQRALRNAMGFNNEGAHKMAATLRRWRSSKNGAKLKIAVNIGKNKNTSLANAPTDYRMVTRLVAKWADFLVINVSSPNTPGLRDLQAVSSLRPIVEAVQDEIARSSYRSTPVLVKIAPDLANEQIIEVAQLVNHLNLGGVVATNTTIAHDLGAGGVSGPPLMERAQEVIKLLRQHLSKDRIIIGAGGVSTIGDAQKLLEAGANLVEAFTAFIYEGPAWPAKINRELGKTQIDWPVPNSSGSHDH